MLVEFDLAGAEWVVVAYLSGDPNMLRVVENGLSPHIETGKLISRAPEELIIKEHKLLGTTTDAETVARVRKEQIPELLVGDFFLPRSMTIRQASKKSNHGLNYDMRYRRFALENEMMESEAEPIVHLYRTEAYPELLTWHEEIREELKATRTMINLMGRKIKLMDQFGPDLYNSAYAYKPQSTVADIITEAMCLAYEDDSEVMSYMMLAANVHDSLMVNYPHEPWDRFTEFNRVLKKHMRPELEARGRKFQLDIDVKCGHNWGDMMSLEAATTKYGRKEVTE